MRAKSLSSPSPVLSGKSSPCSYSGKSSPCSAADECKLTSPRKKFLDHIAIGNKTVPADKNKSPRMNIRDIFFTKTQHSCNDYGDIPLNGAPIPASTTDTELTNIPEEVAHPQPTWNDMVDEEITDSQSNSNADNELANGRLSQYSQTSGFEDEYLTLQQWRDKYNIPNHFTNAAQNNAVDFTISKMNDMENAFLEKNLILGDNREIITQPNVTNSNNHDDLVNGLTDAVLANNTEEAKNNALQTESKKMNENNNFNSYDDRKPSIGPLKYSNVLNRTAPIRSATVANKPLNAKVNPTVRSVSGPITNKPTTISNNSPIESQSKKLPIKSLSTTNVTRTITNKPTIPSKSITEAQHITNNIIPSNVTRRLATRSKTMTDMASNKKHSATSITNLTQRDRFDSSTSTLKASNEQITPTGSNNKLNSKHAPIGTRKSEPRSMPKHNEGDDDGWLTVKARRRSSLHWANRFNQPTGYTSLPTLALLNPDEENMADASIKNGNKKDMKKMAKPTVGKTSKVDAPKQKVSVIVNAAKSKATTTTHNEFKLLSKVQQTVPVQEMKSKSVKLPEKKSITVIGRPTTMVRPKSGLTGLKLTSLHKEYLKKERTNKIPLTNGGLRSMDDSKISMNIQTNVALTPAMRDLYTSCLEIKNLLAKDENKYDTENEDEMEHDEYQRKLLEEQECLERQIFELQNTEIEIDTETDDADCETGLDLDENDDASYQENSSVDQDDNISLEARYHSLLSDMTLGERSETLATLQAIVSRHPGRAQELHQKLSSPSRRRSLHETLKKYQAKQARAQDMRDTLSKDKSLKIQSLLARVEDVKAAKQQLIEEKRMRMEEKLQRYAENRTQYLKDKVRKAHDEEEKLKEIAFIKSLEAQNKRLDLMELRKEQEGRLQDLEQERQKRVEEKAAKEAAVERRRQELAKERQKRLEKMDETRREREQRVEQMQEEKEKKRQKIAREKVTKSFQTLVIKLFLTFFSNRFRPEIVRNVYLHYKFNNNKPRKSYNAKLHKNNKNLRAVTKKILSIFVNVHLN